MNETDLEKFVEAYLEALKTLDTDKILALIDTLETDEDKAAAFQATIKALEADEELLKDNPKMLETLEFVKKVAEDMASKDGAKDEANTAAEVEVAAPSIKMTDPAPTEA